MVDKKLVEYIKDNLQKGHSLEEIRKFIVNYGWSDKDFDEAVILASGSTGKETEKGKVPEPGKEEGMKVGKKKGHKKLILSIIILIILIFIFLFAISDILNYFLGYYPETLLPFNISLLGG
jgi:hypothetical protein